MQGMDDEVEGKHMKSDRPLTDGSNERQKESKNQQPG